jgi:hypothetical protein
VEVGQNILTIDRESYNLYQVQFIEPIPLSAPITIDLVGAVGSGVVAPGLAAGGVSQPTSTITQIDMLDGQLGQFRARLLDDFQAIIYQPQGVQRDSTMNVVARLNLYQQLLDPSGHETELFCFEQQRPFVQAINNKAVAAPQVRVGFYGYRYALGNDKGPGRSGGHVEPIRRFESIMTAINSGLKFTVVPVGGWGR